MKRLSAQAKIIIALLRKQPQVIRELLKTANIDYSTFSRNRRILVNSEIIKEVQGKIALESYVERKGLWDRKREELELHGGYLLNLKVDRLECPIERGETNLGIPEYGKTEFIRGVIVPRKSHELKEAAGIKFPSLSPLLSGETYEVALLTPDFVKNGDRVWWKEESFIVSDQQEIFDGYDLSYRTAILTQKAEKKR